MLISSSNFFFKRSSLKLRYENVTRIVLCCSHQACCLLYYLREINNGIHIYQFTFDFYTSVSGCGCGFGLEQKFWRIHGFGESKARIGGFAYPYSPPSLAVKIVEKKERDKHQWVLSIPIPLSHKNNSTLNFVFEPEYFIQQYNSLCCALIASLCYQTF